MEKETDRRLIRIAIVGPESTGKTSLAEALAGHFSEPFVPEFAREYLEERGGKYDVKELVHIAREQLKMEKTVARQSRQLLICDTNVLSVKVWSDFKYGFCDQSIEILADETEYHHVFLTDIDVPWQYDPLRENPAPGERKQLLEMHRQWLVSSGTSFTLLTGNSAIRERQAVAVLEKLIKNFR